MSEAPERDDDSNGRDRSVVAPEASAALGLGRLLAFSDGVFAVAITLLIIDIRVPDVSGPNEAAALHAALSDLLPNFLGFLISFLVIGTYWIAHHRIYRSIARYDGRLLWLNLTVLLTIVVVPFSTSLIGHYGDLPYVVAIYAINMVLVGLSFLVLFAYAAGPGHLTRDDLQPGGIRASLIRLAVAPVIFLLSIPLAYVSTNLAEFFWLTIPLVYEAIRHGLPLGDS